MENGINEFIAHHTSKDIPSSAFDDWRQEILTRCAARLTIVDDRNNRKTPYLDVETMRALRCLHNHLVVVPLDKAANNVGFICRALYCKVLRNEITSSSAYELVEDEIKQEEATLTAHGEYLRARDLAGAEKLPFLYALPKFHKNPTKFRFITAAVGCSTSKLSKVLSDCLNFILETLREKDNESILSTGVRRFFVVQTYEEISSFLAKWQRKKGPNPDVGLYTGDFSTMYTTIPHDNLLEAIRSTTREAYDWASSKSDMQEREPCLKWHNGSCYWIRARTTNHSDSTHILSWDSLIELVGFLINNSHLKMGNSVYRQTHGIPMGTNCAPTLANLFLYYYESKYVSNLVDDGKVDEARTFHTTFRLIDDVLSLDNPHLNQAIEEPYELGGLYPRALTLEKTSKNNHTVEFVGMNIKTRGRRLCLSVYDKRKDFPFKVRRYPRMNSLIPKTIPYGVLQGQLYRGYRICTDADSFVSHAIDVASALRENGCCFKRLKRIFKSFLANKVRKYSCTGQLKKRFCEKVGSL